YKAQPFPGPLFADRRGFQSSTDARVPFQIGGGQTGISLVPNLRQHGVASLELLEAAFVGAAAPKQPMSSGIADAIAGKKIEAETELIYEVVHVALIAAVIVAEKTQPLGTADQHPAREVDGADAPQTSGLDNVSRCIVDHQKNTSEREEPQEAGF